MTIKRKSDRFTFSRRCAARCAENYGANGSTEIVKSELAIFDGPSYQVTHNKGQWLELAPQNKYQGTTGWNIIF